ncbi:beta-N-acetylhexosaminidase [Bowmanella yangjiangensis]|uniref:beta-N-acetylhexosaminidase n=1 Tax=Bowmanella yangjiangensis TaxID=2811230 RepID=A0ABS3CXX5_9ALTE|nr:beta-N-acetylhexosaminidase [Bowmanella yangjiangensis]MBN7821977.1 beta-N-acetylhexosaminidase [Bowmanella yangjiangensis]
MIKRTLVVAMSVLLVACQNDEAPATGQAVSEVANTQINLVPYPTSITQSAGHFTFSGSVKLITDDNAPDSAAAISALLSQLGIKQTENDNAVIRLVIDPSLTLGDEGYQLAINQGIEIKAANDAGLFYGVQSLRQLLPAKAQEQYVLPHIRIEDQPQYEWRGSMLDVARNFQSLDYLKQHVERMASFKLNKLHLHLTDDQGWRLEIKSWPKLATVGGSTQVGGGPGGYYTQEQMRELVEFAAQHQVEIIPEIDLPGHTQAAIASYNELACGYVTESPVQNQCRDMVGEARLGLYEGTCVGFSALCTSEKPDLTYRFVEEVLTEVAAIFPSKYLHIGGDEVLNEEKTSFAGFITQVDKIVASLDREVLAWEEASKGDIRPSSLLQLWNDNYDIQPALDKGIHLVLSPCSYTYLDHGNYNGQPETYTWCAKEGVPLERVYSLTPENYAQAVGVEGAMWSELVRDEATADNRNWPRLAAIAEVSWTPQAQRNYEQFTGRLSELRGHLDQLNIQYHKEAQLNWQ